jgi:hypothetical protein
VLRRIFGPKRDGVMGGWRKLQNFYSSPNIIRIIKWRRIRWVRYVAQMGDKKNVYRLLVGKTKGKRPLRRPKCGWVDSIKMGLVEIRWGGMDWIGLA